MNGDDQRQFVEKCRGKDEYNEPGQGRLLIALMVADHGAKKAVGDKNASKQLHLVFNFKKVK